MWKISGKALGFLNREVTAFTMTEGEEFQETRTWPGYIVLVKDIVFCNKTTNTQNHVVWGRVKALRGLDCHSFLTSIDERFDAVNDFKVY